MRFLVDNQLPAALARSLSASNVDCLHVLDVGLAQSSDAEICRYAETAEMVLISKDEDFLHLANRPGAALRLLLEAVGRAGPRIVASLEARERVIELR